MIQIDNARYPQKQLRLMSEARRLETWSASELADAADVSVPTAHNFSRDVHIEQDRRHGGPGRPPIEYALTEKSEQFIDRQMSAFFRQIVTMLKDEYKLSDAEARSRASDAFDERYPHVEYEHAVEPTQLSIEHVQQVLS